jgi:hypothetical protein
MYAMIISHKPKIGNLHQNIFFWKVGNKMNDFVANKVSATCGQNQKYPISGKNGDQDKIN